MADPLPPGLAQPGGATLRLSTSIDAICSGRGKPLTPAEERLLKEICQARKEEAQFSDRTKKFWMRIADIFEEVSGRSYSWQSCRRRMLEWEAYDSQPFPEAIPGQNTEQALALSALNLPPTFAEPSRDNDFEKPSTPQDAPALRAPSDDVSMSTPSIPAESNIGEDDFLPETPIRPLHRGHIHPKSENDLTAAQANIRTLVMSSLDAFESQLNTFVNTLFDETDDRRNVRIAFDNLRDEVEKGIDKYGRTKSSRTD